MPKAHFLGLSVKNAGQCPVYSKHSANALLEVGLALLVLQSDFEGLSDEAWRSPCGESRTIVVFGFWLWSGGAVPVERGGPWSVDENPVMGPGEACGPETIYWFSSLKGVPVVGSLAFPEWHVLNVLALGPVYLGGERRLFQSVGRT